MPAIAPQICAEWFMLSPPFFAIIADTTRYSGPKTNPGIMGGIINKPILAVGYKKIPAKTTADTAPDAPRLL